MRLLRSLLLPTGLVMTLGLSVPELAQAADPVQLSITLRGNRFEPTELRLPARTPAILTIHNEDEGAEEFESKALRVEKVIPGRSQGVVRLPPLAPGRYAFVGEYHESTAKGVLIVEGGP
jgi:hypothetical protein